MESTLYFGLPAPFAPGLESKIHDGMVGLVEDGFEGGRQMSSSVKPIKVVEVPGYCEGVVFDRGGHAYISDTQNGTVYRVTPDGSATVWAKTGAPNGHKILPDGTHLVCDGSKHAVLRLDADGKVLDKASSECNGKPLRAPNDLSLDPKGGFYFTDPGCGGTRLPQRGRSAPGRQNPARGRERVQPDTDLRRAVARQGGPHEGLR